MKFKINELKNKLIDILSSKYYTKEEAENIADVFLYAELTGKNTQGILKLFGSEPAQDIKPIGKYKVTKETELSAIIDGGGASGPLVAQVATEKLISIASKKGFGIVGTNNTFSSIGAISYYARKLALENLIGIVMASSPRGLIHFGGIDPMYGTNPISFSFPTNDYPIIFDMASSAITWYGLVRAKTLGHDLPDNVAIDSEGSITLDPDQAMKGAILPFDRSYKGSGIAMVVELLAGALTGASFVFDEGDWGSTFIAISPDLLIGTDQFKNNSSELIRKVKSGRTQHGKKIHIPGYDKEIEMQKLLLQDEINIEDTIADNLLKL